MTKQELNDAFGIPSWLELLKALQAQGAIGEETVKMEVPTWRPRIEGEPPPQTWTLRVNDIKAWAFDEIYNRLPLPDSVLIMQEMVGELAQQGAKELAPFIQTFLNNIPTRTL